jgi:sugar phosphate permease
MNAESSAHLARLLEQEQSTIPKVANVRSALRNPNVIWLCLQYFCWSVGVYGFVLWLPSMIKQGALSEIEITGLLSAIPYLFAIILMVIVSYYSDRSLRRTRFVWPFLILSGMAFLGSYLTADHNFWIAYAFLILAGGAMYAPYGPFFAIIPEMLPSNVAGDVTALINSCGALGSFLGSWVVGFLQGYTGNSRAGYLLMSVSLLLSGIIVLLIREPSKDAQSAITQRL